MKRGRLVIAGALALSCGSRSPGAKDGDADGAGAAADGWGAGDVPGAPVDGACGGDASDLFTLIFRETPPREMDVLFMIDDSSGMAAMQDQLIAQLPVFMNVLESLPGGLPSLHIGVVSSDMGAGPETGIPQCAPGGDLGRLHSAVGPNGRMNGSGGLVPCTVTGLSPGQTFISNADGVANYTGPISDVLGCIAGLGDLGCSFEHPIESVVRALGADGLFVPDENAGFLRRTAQLAILFFTDEDDCSAPPDTGLFDPDDPSLGPLTSFRCNEYGHLCDGAPPPRDMEKSYAFGACHDNPGGALIPIETLVRQIQSLKPDPASIIVAAVAGYPDPYAVHLESSGAGQPPSGTVGHACSGGGLYADPGVRLAEFVAAFNGVMLSACAASYAPVLQQLARRIGEATQPQCVPFVKLGGDGKPACTVVQRVFNEAGEMVSTALPFCGDEVASPCWSLVAGEGLCDSYRFDLRRDTPVSNATIYMFCTGCAGDCDPACMTRDR